MIVGLVLLWSLGPASLADDTVTGLEAALEDIRTRFPQSVAGDALYQAALQGVADHLGQRMGTSGNRVLTQEQLTKRERWSQGDRTGIGAEFGIFPGRGLVLTEVFDNSPADTAGLRPGDLVVSVDDHPLTGLRAGAIHARVRSSTGTIATFDVRQADGAIHRVSIPRGPYRAPHVRFRTERGSPVVRISYFGTDTAAALAELLDGWPDKSAVVLDLRDNEGGAIDEMVAVADLFLDPGAVVVHTRRGDGPEVPLASASPARWTPGVVVLINRGTSGIAEAFVAAMQDHDRAQVVGTRSAGHGVETSFYPVGRGFVLAIADISLGSPAGRDWNQTGLTPDLFVEPPGMSVPVSTSPIPPDLQRDAAIRLISTTPSGEGSY